VNKLDRSLFRSLRCDKHAPQYTPSHEAMQFQAENFISKFYLKLRARSLNEREFLIYLCDPGCLANFIFLSPASQMAGRHSSSKPDHQAGGSPREEGLFDPGAPI